MDLRVFLKLDGSGFNQGLTAAKQAVGRFGSQAFGGLKAQVASMFGAGALIYAAQRIGRAAIDAADKWSDMSGRLQANVEVVQAMAFALEQAGGKGEDLVRILERMNVARVEALSGKPGNESAAAFQTLGVSESDLRKKRSDELILQISKAFEQGSYAKLMPAFRKVADRGAGIMVKAFTDGLEEGMAKARERGAVMTAEQVAAISSIKDEMTALSTIVTTQAAPAIVKAMRLMVEAGFALRTAFSFLSAGFGGAKGLAAAALGPSKVITVLTTLAGFGTTKAAAAAKDSALDAAKVMERLDRVLAENAAKLLNPQVALDFSDVQPEAAKIKAGKVGAQTSDSLVSVGNFLGSGRHAIESIYKENLQVSRQHLAVSRQTLRAVEALKQGGIEVP